MRGLVIATTAALLGLGAAASVAVAQPPAQPAPAAPKAPLPCNPVDKLTFICGLRPPEDLVKLPGGPWIISGGIGAVAQQIPGEFYFINEDTKALSRVKPAAGAARAPYNACPGPLDLSRFSPHGLNIRAQGAGRAHLFVVGHGGREAIEVFEAASGSGTPTLTWIGCVPAPAGAFMNSVTALSDGRIIATNYYNAPKTQMDALRGEDSGWVMQWKPGGAFEKLGGTDLPGPNGVEVTPDNRWLFVAVTGTSQVLRFDLNDTWRAPTFIRPNMRTDNLRWAPDGKLLLAGPGVAPNTGPAVVALDTGPTLKTTDVLRRGPLPEFPGHSGALISGKTLWLGTYNGDRVAYTPLP